MQRPVIFSSTFPPSERTFRGAISLRLASGGADVDELIEDFTVAAENFDEYFPDDAPVTPDEVPAIVDEVVAEYQRVVTEMSPDAVGLMTSLDDLFAAGILYSYGDTDEPSDALEFLEDALESIAAEGGQLRGFLYSVSGDLDDMVLHQRLEIAFGTFDADATALPALAEKAVQIFTAHGLAASWSGDPGHPIVIDPIVVDAPLVEEEDDDDHAGHHHDHDGHHH
ncbi:MAG TPA: hypothetical protein DEG88_02170 [Propionibacteriaceae bacterium]|nr:hypothetical protein [Propionibacteriaceae bacterium]HBY22134.1 hypothetical protein [Propionibacteriaceae bacterium]